MHYPTKFLRFSYKTATVFLFGKRRFARLLDCLAFFPQTNHACFHTTRFFLFFKNASVFRTHHIDWSTEPFWSREKQIAGSESQLFDIVCLVQNWLGRSVPTFALSWCMFGACFPENIRSRNRFTPRRGSY